MVALAGVLTGALQARSAFAEINVIGTLTGALLVLAPLAVAATVGAELAGLVAAVAAVRMLVLLLLFWRCQRWYRAAAPWSVDRQLAAQLLRFGGWTTVSAVAGPLLVVLDRFLIGAHLGAKAVSHYVIPFQLAERTTMLSSALGYALFPRFAGSTLESDRQRLAMHGLRVLAAWTSPLVAVGLLLSGPFLAWWISPSWPCGRPWSRRSCFLPSGPAAWRWCLHEAVGYRPARFGGEVPLGPVAALRGPVVCRTTRLGRGRRGLRFRGQSGSRLPAPIALGGHAGPDLEISGLALHAVDRHPRRGFQREFAGGLAVDAGSRVVHRAGDMVADTDAAVGPRSKRRAAITLNASLSPAAATCRRAMPRQPQGQDSGG